MESATFKTEILELELAQFGVTSVHFPKIQPTLAEGHGLLHAVLPLHAHFGNFALKNIPFQLNLFLELKSPICVYPIKIFAVFLKCISEHCSH